MMKDPRGRHVIEADHLYAFNAVWMTAFLQVEKSVRARTS